MNAETSPSFWDEMACDTGDFRRVPEGEKGSGSPLVTPEGGGEPVRYKRATSFISAAEDDYGIAQWKRHLTVDGIFADPEIAARWAAAAWGEKVDLSGRAFEQAGGYVKANNGTRMHTLTDLLDSEADHLGTDVTASELADLNAYTAAVKHWTPLLIEPKTVLDEYGVAGTPDRVWTMPGWAKPRIGDLKTGKIDARKCAMQMALYAHSRLYDVTTGQRTDLDVDLDVGMIVHLPYGEARTRVLQVDIASGWEGVQLCAAIHAWRQRTGMSKVWAPPAIDYVVLATQATSLADLTALHAQAVAADAWDFMVRAAFTLRKQQLAAVAA